MPFCTKLSEILLNLDEEKKKSFMSTAVEYGYDKFVDLRAGEVGLTRKQATFALVPVTFYGKKTTQIKQGTIVSTLDNRLYYLTENIILDENGEGEGICKAQNSGSQYNVKAKEICYLPVKYADVISVENKESYNDAYDEESNEDLYNRYLLKVRTPATSGNKHHYEQWASEVTGVGYAKCVPAEVIGQGGKVKVIIANSNKRGASEELIQEVYNYIESVRPVLSGTLEVVTVKEIPISITGKVEIDTSITLSEVQEIFRNLIEDYLDNNVYKTKKISIAKIQSMLIDIEGVIDCANIKINGNASNISLSTDVIAVLKNIELWVI